MLPAGKLPGQVGASPTGLKVASTVGVMSLSVQTVVVGVLVGLVTVMSGLLAPLGMVLGLQSGHLTCSSTQAGCRVEPADNVHSFYIFKGVQMFEGHADSHNLESC
jgi:hypothetical protein